MAVNWNRRSYTREKFREAWNSSLSIAQCARALDLSIYGNTYLSLKEAAAELNLTNEHMTGQGWNKGKNFNFSKPKTPIKDFFKEDIKLSSKSA